MCYLTYYVGRLSASMFKVAWRGLVPEAPLSPLEIIIIITKEVKKKMIKVPQQIMTSYDRIANERPVYTVNDQW